MSESQLTVYGAGWCRDCTRTRSQLDGLGIAYRYIDIESEPGAANEAQRISGRMNIPVVVYPDGGVQVEPANAEVEEKLRAIALI